MKTLLALLLATSSLTLGTAAVAGPANEAAVDPYQIFTHARDVWRAERYPAHLAYTISVRVCERGVEKSNHYHATYVAQSNHVSVAAVSDEELAKPPTGEGTVFHLAIRRQNRTLVERRVGNPGDAVDFLGIPLLAPNYSFGLSHQFSTDGASSDGLVQQIRAEFNDPMPAAKAQEMARRPGLKEIAVLNAWRHDYDVHLAGVDVVAGTNAYHLLLRPTHDPNKLRLRELWVAEKTYATLQLVNADNFTGTHVPWLITFAEIGGSHYIASEVAMDPISLGDHRYEAASIAFDAITPIGGSTLPFGSLYVATGAALAEPDSVERR